MYYMYMLLLLQTSFFDLIKTQHLIMLVLVMYFDNIFVLDQCSMSKSRTHLQSPQQYKITHLHCDCNDGVQFLGICSEGYI